MINERAAVKANLLLATFLCLVAIAYPQVTVTRYSVGNTAEELPSNIVYAVAIQPGTDGDVVWFGCRNADRTDPVVYWPGGLARFDQAANFGTGEWFGIFTDNSLLPDVWVFDMEFDHAGNLWIGTRDGGLAKIAADALDSQPSNIGWDIFIPSNSGIGHDRIYEVSVDPDGNIWVGHGGGDLDAPNALSIYDGTSQWVTITSANTPLAENACYAIEFGQPGVAWLGLKNQGLFEFNYNGTPFDTGDDTYTRHQSEHLQVNAASMAVDSTGKVWFGHHRGYGATRYDPVADSWYNFMPVVTSDEYARFRSIKVDSDGVVWLGDKSGINEGSTGLWRYDEESDSEPVNVFRQPDGDLDGLENDDNYINQIALDELNGVVWLATDCNGSDPECDGVLKIEGLALPTEDDTTVSAIELDNRLMTEFSLRQNYPNPFNAETVIGFTLWSRQSISLSIYDLQGGLIKTLLTGTLPAGFHQVTWNGTDLQSRPVSSGVYLYGLHTKSGLIDMRKAVLMK